MTLHPSSTWRQIPHPPPADPHDRIGPRCDEVGGPMHQRCTRLTGHPGPHRCFCNADAGRDKWIWYEWD